MHMSGDWTQWIEQIAGYAPALFWLLIGAALCCMNARLQPKRATLIGIALGIMAVHHVITRLFFGHLITWLEGLTGSMEAAIAAAQIAAGIPHAFAMLLILWAAFHGDSRYRPDDGE